MANNTFKEIAEVLLNAQTILIFPHINADGDAAGSASALCHTLREMGKTAYILIEDQIPANQKFMDRGYFTFDDKVIEHPDVSICVDCGDFGRFPKRREKFISAQTTVCVDHHGTTEEFCEFNYVDPAAAAKVLALTDRFAENPKLCTLMITHNMRDAITYGNRLIMMYDGHIVVDVSGEEKKHLTVEHLLGLFSQASGSTEVNDKMVLS